jgi:hypothetical protein
MLQTRENASQGSLAGVFRTPGNATDTPAVVARFRLAFDQHIPAHKAERRMDMADKRHAPQHLEAFG